MYLVKTGRALNFRQNGAGNTCCPLARHELSDSLVQTTMMAIPVITAGLWCLCSRWVLPTGKFFFHLMLGKSSSKHLHSLGEQMFPLDLKVRLYKALVSPWLVWSAMKCRQCLEVTGRQHSSNTVVAQCSHSASHFTFFKFFNRKAGKFYGFSVL